MATVKNKATYSLLLMRDDSGVKTLRVRGFWFKILALALLVLIVTCGFAIYTAQHYVLISVRATERAELAESQLKAQNLELERLRNIEKVPVGGKTVSSSSSGSTSSSSGVASDSAEEPPAGDATLPVTEADLAQLLGQDGPMASGPVGVITDTEQNDHPVKIANLKLRTRSSSSLRISFELSNQDPRLTLIGRCNVYIITRQRAIVPVTPVQRGVTSFQIAKFRRIEADFKLPDTITAQDIVAIQVTAKANDLPLYTKTFIQNQ